MDAFGVSEKVIDLKSDPIYFAHSEPEMVHIPQLPFIMVDGKGSPTISDGESEFQAAMRILFGIICTIKFWDKQHAVPEGYAKFNLSPVEAIWWTKSGKQFDSKRTDDWRWTLMLRVPEFVTPKYFEEVVGELMRNRADASYRLARLEVLGEGWCMQVLHTGSYDKVTEAIDKLQDAVRNQKHKICGRLHELYLNDPNRTKQEDLKTIIRYPVEEIK